MVVLSLVMTIRAGTAEQVEGDVLELEADLLGDDLTTGEDGHVLQHRLAAIAEAGGLDGCRVERATDLVDHQGGQASPSMSSAMMSSGLPDFIDLLEHRAAWSWTELILPLVEQDVGVFEDGLLALRVGDEVRREVALVELHALGELELGAEGVDSSTVTTPSLPTLSMASAMTSPTGVGGGDGGDSGDLILVVDSLGLALDALDCRGDGLLDARLRPIGLAPAATLRMPCLHHGLCQHGGGGGAVTGDVVGLGGDLLHELGAHVLERVLELDLLRDGHTVVGDGGAPNFLSRTTLRPFGPRVTLTASASLFTPASRARRASSWNFSSLPCGVSGSLLDDRRGRRGW
jgi:hypothetical protein